ncbi:MAG TPA: YggS family pyridoxal phosphate-dependent enzyme [Jatrophihabitantaceae bacterium]|jgi:pyridoxal phosphate enzyme (YggS family)
MAPLGGERRAELVGSLGAVRARLADACIAAGRDPHSVTLIAITKTFPGADVATLAALGVGDIGESRDQEASAKVAEVAELMRTGAADERVAPLRWHFVGRLQSRKSRSVASYAHAVHSVDRPELVEQLAVGVARAGRGRLDVFVQVSLDGDPSRGGVLPDRVVELADAVAARSELRLRGVMAVAPMAADPRAAFADLAAAAARLRAAHPDADAISAGMSADLEAAVAHGSTHVRVGSALLGRRSQVFG